MNDVHTPTKRLLSKTTLSAAVATIGVISGILGIYSGFFYDKKPALNIAVLSNAPVVDVKEDVAELTLSFKGERLRESKRTVSVIVLRVANVGNAPILPNYYDLENDWGIELHGGDIVAVTFENASTDYLSGKLADFSKTNPDPRLVALPRMILESEQGFTIRILALHADSVQPSVTAFGKIATIAAPSVTTLPLESNRPTIGVAFGGSIAAQILRFAGYGLGFIAVLIMGISAGAYLSTVSEKRQKRRIALHCARLLEPEGATEDEELKAAIRLYREGGLEKLRQVNFYIQDPKRLRRFLDREEENAKKRESLTQEYEDRSVEAQLLKKYAQPEGDSFKISPTFIAKLHLVMEEAGIKGQETEPGGRFEEVFIEGRPIGIIRRENEVG
jgi:hypothetical protein